MHFHDQDGGEASRAPGPVKIFCMILTAPKNFDTKARAVNLTWAHQCDSFRFMTVIPKNSSLPKPPVGLGLDQPEGHSRESYGQLTSKVYSSLKHLYKHHRGYDWYVKADDDTYFFMANLRAFLSDKNPKAALFYGHKFQFYLSSYHSGGAGYVISSGAMKQLGHLLSQEDFGHCPNTGVEDQDVAACLRKLSIYPKEANDRANGLPLFNYGRLQPQQWSKNRVSLQRFDSSQNFKNGINLLLLVSRSKVSARQPYPFTT